MNTFARWMVVFACIAALALSAAAQTTWAVRGANGALINVTIRHVDRTVLGRDVAHYRFEVAIGPGKFDVIRLHRVVREKHPWQPVHTVTGVLLCPGAPNSFEMIFMEPLISPGLAWDHSVTAFLAKKNIDVWGIDYRWALVPAETKQFKFMKGWGLERDVEDAKIALSLSRLIRGATGQGFDRLHVLGFSYGVFMAYAIGNQETQLPYSLRNVKGLIAADWGMVYPADSPMRAMACDPIPDLQAQYDSGVYYEDNSGLKQIGDLARSAPDDLSPFADGFTNYQFALLVGASGDPPIYWHFVGGVFNEAGITTGLQYTDPWLWIDVIRAVPPYLALKADLDTDKVNCYDVLAPFDDHLGEVTIPILYVGSAGGTGDVGSYSATLTASTDFTKFTVQLHPDEERALDFGHADLFTAKNADKLVWKPIVDWLVAHK